MNPVCLPPSVLEGGGMNYCSESLRQCSTPCVTCSPSLWSFKCLAHPQRPFAPLGGVKMVPCHLIVTTIESHVPCFPSDRRRPSSPKSGDDNLKQLWATPHLLGSGWLLVLTVFEPKLLLRKKKSQPHAQDHSLPGNKPVLACNT